MIYTTNAIEALNRQLRKAIETKGHFPNEDAGRKLIYLAVTNAVPAWTRTRTGPWPCSRSKSTSAIASPTQPDTQHSTTLNPYSRVQTSPTAHTDFGTPSRDGSLMEGSCFTLEQKLADAGAGLWPLQRARVSGLSDPGALVPGAARRPVSSWADGAARRAAIPRGPVRGVRGVVRRDSTASGHARAGPRLPVAPLVQDGVDLVAHLVAGGSTVNP